MSEHKNNGKKIDKIYLTEEERKELFRIASGLQANLMKMEGILAAFNEHYTQAQVANNACFLDAIHSLEKTINYLEKITEPLKKLL